MGEVDVEPDLGMQATELLVQLIRINTVNPPGNERAAQELLKSYLAGAGLECRLVGAEGDRQNLIANLSGNSPGAVLCYLGHIDTVLADPKEWAVDPWSGVVNDGFVWGRGALDMKGQVAAEVVACAELARSGWRPAKGTLRLVICCDEEAGGRLGAQWLCEHVAEDVRADYVINEGGGAIFSFGDKRLYELCVAEKGVFRFNLSTEGRAAHASTPGVGENALLGMVPVLDRLSKWRSKPEPSPEVEAFLSTVLDEEKGGVFEERVRRVLEREPRMAAFLEPMLGLTMVPTMIRASEKENVIPSRCDLRVDCRVPPGRDAGYVKDTVREAIGVNGYRLSFEEQVVGNRSPLEGPVVSAIGDFIEQEDPSATTVPIVLPGFTDSRWFRYAFDSAAYGFCPQRAMDVIEAMPLIHGPDERIAMSDLDYAARFFYAMAPKLLGRDDRR